MLVVRLTLLTIGLSVTLLCVGIDPLSGAVTDSSREGFTVKCELTIQAPPATVYRHLVEDMGRWWDPSHTYSGDASNLYLQAEPKGWFGERLPNGGLVKHMEVVAVFPGKRLRLQGALGPLQEFAVIGSLTIDLSEADQGTRVTWTYCVGGYRPGGLADFAQPVDGVLLTQLQRLKKLAETGTAQ